jgi:hypothetical protein
MLKVQNLSSLFFRVLNSYDHVFQPFIHFKALDMV